MNTYWTCPEGCDEFKLFTLPDKAAFKQEVFDKDRFSADDKMGHAQLSLQPLVAAARLKQILKVATDWMTLRKVIPENDNCLAAESSIFWKNGEVMQDVWLRLC